MKFIQIATLAVLMASTTEATKLNHLQRHTHEVTSELTEDDQDKQQAMQKQMAEAEAFLDELDQNEFDWGNAFKKGRNVFNRGKNAMRGLFDHMRQNHS